MILTVIRLKRSTLTIFIPRVLIVCNKVLYFSFLSHTHGTGVYHLNFQLHVCTQLVKTSKTAFIP